MSKVTSKIFVMVHERLSVHVPQIQCYICHALDELYNRSKINAAELADCKFYVMRHLKVKGLQRNCLELWLESNGIGVMNIEPKQRNRLMHAYRLEWVSKIVKTLEAYEAERFTVAA